MKNALIFSLIGIVLLVSCEPDDKVNTVILKNYAVNALITDNSNTLWAGTDSGLYRISGNEHEYVDINNVAAVKALAYEKQNNTIWVGTNNGLIKLILAGSESNSETIPSSNLSNTNIQSIYISSLEEKWISSDTGITRNSSDVWQKEKFKQNLSGSITSAAFEKISVNSISSWDGDFYIATNVRSVYRTYDWNESVNAFSGATQLLKPYNGTNLTDTVFVVFVDSKGKQWMGGLDGILMHTGHDPKAENTSYTSELTNLRVHCIVEAPDGKIWAGTEKGISIFDGTDWKKLSFKLPDEYVTSIAFETDGQTWIGTKKGIVLY